MLRMQRLETTRPELEFLPGELYDTRHMEVSTL